MADINSITSATAQSATITQAVQNQDLGRDAFLRLLTVQLQNQDPTDPVKNEDFVAQLSQFSSLEQLQQINKGVNADTSTEGLANLQQSVDNNTAVSMIGREVEIPLDVVSYGGDGSVQLSYSLYGPANKVDISIFNEFGEKVRTVTKNSPDEGAGSITWDGKNDFGQDMPEGIYHLVPSAVNGSGNFVAVQALLKGPVTGVRYADGKPMLTLQGQEVPLSSVGRITQTE